MKQHVDKQLEFIKEIRLHEDSSTDVGEIQINGERFLPGVAASGNSLFHGNILALSGL